MWTNNDDPIHGWDGQFDRFEVVGHIPDSDIRQTITLLQSINSRATHAELVMELGRMRATTISRASGTDDVALVISAYASALTKFPADAVVASLRYWGENEKFWPALVEIKAHIQNMVRRRAALREALDAAK